MPLGFAPVGPLPNDTRPPGSESIEPVVISANVGVGGKPAMADSPMLCLTVSLPVMPLQSPHIVYRRSSGAQVGVQSPQPLARRVMLEAPGDGGGGAAAHRRAAAVDVVGGVVEQLPAGDGERVGRGHVVAGPAGWRERAVGQRGAAGVA